MTKYFKIAFCLLGFILIMSSCDQKPKIYVLKGKALNFDGDSVLVQLPVKGSFFYRINNQKVPVDDDGGFELALEIESPGFAVVVHSATRSSIDLWIESGATDSLVIDFTKTKEAQYFGDNKAANETLNSFERIPYFHAFGGEDEKYQKDSIASRVYQTVMGIHNDEMAEIDRLLKEGKVSAAYAEAVRYDSEFHWKSVFASAAWRHYYFKYELKRESYFNNEWMELYKKLFEETNFNNEKAIVSNYYRTLSEDYVRFYKSSILNKTERDTTLSAIENSNIYHEKRLSVIKSDFSGSNKELVWANYLFSEGLQKQFQKALLTSYDEFKLEYPDSPYDPILVKYIEPIRDYHTKLESSIMHDNIILIENGPEFTTWGEVIDPYKGELLYVDLWATWCGPCKDEFNHKRGLYEFIKDKPIRILYVSSDKDNSDQRWKEMVNYYGLEGINIRINQTLNWDIWKLIHDKDFSSIPRYLIIDQDGKMVEKDAARPSEGQKLFDQLAKYL